MTDEITTHRRRLAIPQIMSLYDVLEEVAEQLGTIPSENIYSLDDTGLQPPWKQKAVICLKGSSSSHTAGCANRDGITLLICICADGTSPSPRHHQGCSSQDHALSWENSGQSSWSPARREHNYLPGDNFVPDITATADVFFIFCNLDGPALQI